jgi:hypothetical protein
MGSHVVVVLPPALDDGRRLRPRPEPLEAQTLVAELPVEALGAMRLQPERPPDAADHRVTDARHLGHRARAPVRFAGRRRLKPLHDDRVDLLAGFLGTSPSSTRRTCCKLQGSPAARTWIRSGRSGVSLTATWKPELLRLKKAMGDQAQLANEQLPNGIDGPVATVRDQ